jgi:hypothetical protein
MQSGKVKNQYISLWGNQKGGLQTVPEVWEFLMSMMKNNNMYLVEVFKFYLCNVVLNVMLSNL